MGKFVRYLRHLHFVFISSKNNFFQTLTIFILEDFGRNEDEMKMAQISYEFLTLKNGLGDTKNPYISSLKHLTHCKTSKNNFFQTLTIFILEDFGQNEDEMKMAQISFEFLTLKMDLSTPKTLT